MRKHLFCAALAACAGAFSSRSAQTTPVREFTIPSQDGQAVTGQVDLPALETRVAVVMSPAPDRSIAT
jgi:hypothetical protein